MPTLPEPVDEPPTGAPFVVTKEYRRFAEFADAVRRERYIGLCFGPPGVGKTLSARRYAHWDLVEHALRSYTLTQPDSIPREILDTRTAVYTPTVHNSPGRLERELSAIQNRLSWAIEILQHPQHDPPFLVGSQGRFAELLIVDEPTGSRPPPSSSCATGTTAPASA